MTNLATKLIDEQIIKAYDKGYATATVKCERRMETALKEQAERAEDHFACRLADLILEIEKMKKKKLYLDKMYVDSGDSNIVAVYNLALKDVINLIKGEKQ